MFAQCVTTDLIRLIINREEGGSEDGDKPYVDYVRDERRNVDEGFCFGTVLRLQEETI